VKVVVVTLNSLIDKVLERLHDDGTTFSRQEILGWLAEGYRRLTFNGKHAKTFTAMDLPPRHANAISLPWERNVCNGTWRKWTYTAENGRYECSFTWEVQQLAGTVLPGNGSIAVTQLWELAYTGESVDTHYRFMMPKNDAHILEMWHDEKLLSSVIAKTLDTTEDKWWQISGVPFLWSQSLSDDNTFEVWEIDTEYYESFSYDATSGAPRAWVEDEHTFDVTSETATWGYAYSFNGEGTWATPLSGLGWRFTGYTDDLGTYYSYPWEQDSAITNDADDVYTYAWESVALEYLETGIMRSAVSENRQYFPSYQWSCQGVIREAAKSENAILIYHRVVAKEQLIGEDTLDMLPAQMSKYLIYYALGILLNRQGIGYDPALAGHYELRAGRAIKVLHSLGMITRMDDEFVRGGGQRGRREPPLPSLPSNFARASWLRR
jgi:hypothetical protein